MTTTLALSVSFLFTIILVLGFSQEQDVIS